MGVRSRRRPKATIPIGDLGGLLLAFVLGITYIDFMAVLVIWYGDLPHEEIWFVERDALPWSLLAVVAFLLISAIPVLALLLSRVRNARGPHAGGCDSSYRARVYDAYLIVRRPVRGLQPPLLPSSLIGLGFFALLVGRARACRLKHCDTTTSAGAHSCGVPEPSAVDAHRVAGSRALIFFGIAVPCSPQSSTMRLRSRPYRSRNPFHSRA